ncbi:hypothetical protein [Kordiimonas marina]|uniref:hypothetical protein n=1 Tax=Kordiimonas marina TaxID=2872312 RepID=UPI001FF29D8B|nr:hypothetical protein [Kordiimonas marina]MCJ9430740.1 hypothetical protein [Kordiimonas marina]
MSKQQLFEPLNADRLASILDLTIKHDRTNKLVTFMCALSAFTEADQFNVSYNAPSSTGKSYIPIEIAKLFPADDVMQIGYCSPTAFFHDVGVPDKAKKGRVVVDLSRKILIFLDQPHNELLSRLRPLLSHDSKAINIKITDKSQKQGLRTKDVLPKGFPSVIFSTAGLRVDEQEATRFFLLSPEVHQDKIRQSIGAAIERESGGAKYEAKVERDVGRAQLKERLQMIKDAHITDIRITPKLRSEIQRVFLDDKQVLRPRSQRDIKRFISLMKAFALLNLWWRDRDGSTITVHPDDFAEACALWEELSVSQELNLPPYIYSIYRDVILSAWRDKNKAYGGRVVGLTRGEVLSEHFHVYGRMLDATQLRKQILPMLETTGLVIEERDPHNRSRKFIFPADPEETGDSGNPSGVPGNIPSQVRNLDDREL